MIPENINQRLREEDVGFDYLIVKNNDPQFRAAAEAIDQTEEPGVGQ